MRLKTDPHGEEVRALDALIDVSGADVLEVGCGDGRMTYRYAGPARSVTAIDPNEDDIRRAIEDMPRSLAGTVSFLNKDITTWVPRRRFDIALLAYSL